MARPVRKLSNMEIDEISLVDKGANQHAMITIAKRAPEEDTMPEFYHEDGNLLEDDTELEVGDVVYDADGQAYEYVIEDERELEEVGKAYAVGGNGVASKTGEIVQRHSGLARHKGEGFGSKAKRGAKRFAGNRAVQSGAAAGAGGAAGYNMKKSFTDQVMEELSKAYSDDDRDQVIAKALGRVEELEGAQQEAVEIAKSERDLRLTREYISKAAEYNLPIDPAELGPVLYRMAETMDYNDCAVIAKCLEGAGAMIFEEQGFIGGGDNTDILSQVEARAVEIGKSASPENITAVFDQTPDAYNEYLASRRGN